MSGATPIRDPRERWMLPAAPDPWLLLCALSLLALGLVMVTSASMPRAESLMNGQPFYFLYRQGGYVVAGLLAGGAALWVPLTTWYRRGPLLLLLTVVLLVLVLIPGVTQAINGSHRWLQLGPVNIQVSEIAKLCALVFVAGYLQRHGEELRSQTMAMVRPLLVLGCLTVLLLLEPDFGAAVVLLATALGMIFLAGVSLWRFAALQAVVIVVMAGLLVSSPYRVQRLLSFTDPFEHAFGSGFQLAQSLIAIGRGELFGVGLGASVQKLFYLPEAHTDFVFAILAEELGLLGVAALIGLYGVLVWRAFAAGARALDLDWPFAAYLAYGIGLWFALQALINMGVNMGVLPTKGLTLPLISYGGSSLVMMCLSLGVLLRVDMETRELGHSRRLSRLRQTEAMP